MEVFQPIRGIRQKDPLTLYLYVICMERLGHLTDREVKLSAWKLMRASRIGPTISNLAFNLSTTLYYFVRLQLSKANL